MTPAILQDNNSDIRTHEGIFRPPPPLSVVSATFVTYPSISRRSYHKYIPVVQLSPMSLGDLVVPFHPRTYGEKIQHKKSSIGRNTHQKTDSKLLIFICLMEVRWSLLASSKAYLPLGDFVRAMGGENKNSATWLVKIGWRKKFPGTNKNRSHFFLCSREQIRQVENGLNGIKPAKTRLDTTWYLQTCWRLLKSTSSLWIKS